MRDRHQSSASVILATAVRRRASSASPQLGQITDAVAEGLRQGALGVGVTVGYMTAGVTPAEITAWTA